MKKYSVSNYQGFISLFWEPYLGNWENFYDEVLNIFMKLGKFSFTAYIMNQDRAVTAHLAQGPSPSQFGKILTFFVKLGKIKILIYYQKDIFIS